MGATELREEGRDDLGQFLAQTQSSGAFDRGAVQGDRVGRGGYGPGRPQGRG